MDSMIKGTGQLPEKETLDKLSKLRIMQYSVSPQYADHYIFKGEKNIVDILHTDIATIFPEIPAKVVGYFNDQKINHYKTSALIPHIITAIQFINKNLVNGEYINDIKEYVKEYRTQDTIVQQTSAKNKDDIDQLKSVIKKYQELLTQFNEKLDNSSQEHTTQKAEIATKLTQMKADVENHRVSTDKKFSRLCALQDKVEAFLGNIDDYCDLSSGGSQCPGSTTMVKSSTAPAVANASMIHDNECPQKDDSKKGVKKANLMETIRKLEDVVISLKSQNVELFETVQKLMESQKEINNDLVKLTEKNKLLDNQLADLYKTKYLSMSQTINTSGCTPAPAPISPTPALVQPTQPISALPSALPSLPISAQPLHPPSSIVTRPLSIEKH